MTLSTTSRPGFLASLPTPTKVNALAMIVAAVAIGWQIAAGVAYPPVPPGPVILAAAVILVVLVRAPWARVVGVGVPLFLVVGGVIAAIGNPDNALRHPEALSPFAGTVLQLVAVLVALAAGVLALRAPRSRPGL